MATDLYRYDFDEKVQSEDLEAALLLAIWGCEALHGESQTRLDAAHYRDPAKRACVIDAGTPVGRDLNRLFVGFIGREFGEDAFKVERVAHQRDREARSGESANWQNPPCRRCNTPTRVFRRAYFSGRFLFRGPTHSSGREE